MRKLCIALGIVLLSGVAVAEYGCHLYDNSPEVCEEQFPFCEYDGHRAMCREAEGNACWYFDGEPNECESHSHCCQYSHQVHKCNSTCPSWQKTAVEAQCGSRYQPSLTRRS